MSAAALRPRLLFSLPQRMAWVSSRPFPASRSFSTSLPSSAPESKPSDGSSASPPPQQPHQQQKEWSPFSQGYEHRFHNPSPAAYPEVQQDPIPKTRREIVDRIRSGLEKRPEAPSWEEYEASHDQFGKPNDGSYTLFKRMMGQRLVGFGRAVDFIAERGTFEFVKRTLQMNEIFTRGEFKGTDLYGNNYYQDDHAVFGRQRFVVYKDFSPQGGDASEVPAEWHAWLHHMVDECPTEVPPAPVAYKVRHRRMNTRFTEVDNHLPPGHHRRRDPELKLQDWTSWRPGQPAEPLD